MNDGKTDKNNLLLAAKRSILCAQNYRRQFVIRSSSLMRFVISIRNTYNNIYVRTYWRAVFATYQK